MAYNLKNKHHFKHVKKKIKVFVEPRYILWGHWYSLFRTSDDSAHEFQSRGEYVKLLSRKSIMMAMTLTTMITTTMSD